MKLLLLILILLPLNSFAEIYNYKIIRVIDGDTIVIEAPYLPKPLKPEISLRILGVDTPEKRYRAQCELESGLGEEATDFVKQEVSKSKSIAVEIKDWDKYGGRLLGDLFLDGKSLRKILIDKGYAKEYHGDKKQSWCD